MFPFSLVIFYALHEIQNRGENLGHNKLGHYQCSSRIDILQISWFVAIITKAHAYP